MRKLEYVTVRAMSPGGQEQNSFEDLASEGVSGARSSDIDHADIYHNLHLE